MQRTTGKKSYEKVQVRSYIVMRCPDFLPDRIKMAEMEPVPVELEGGGWNWWYVCGECHAAVGTGDKTCKSCKRKLSWK